MPELTAGARKHTRRDILRLGAVGFGLVALGSACTQAPAPVATAPQPAAPPAPAAPAPAAPAASPAAASATQPSGKVVIMLGAEPQHLDLQLITINAARMVAFDNVVEGLTATDSEMKLVPSLAASWEQLEPTRMRFKLRQGVKFHNGEDFKADAVTLAIQRLNDPNLKSNVLGYVDTIASATAVDDYTVDIVTKGPDPILLRRMSYLPMMAPKALTQNPDQALEKPIGTGPYQLVEWLKGQRISLTAFGGYWGPQKPTIKDAEFQPRKEGSVRLTALKAGEAHLIDNVTPEDAATLPKEQVLTSIATETMSMRVAGKSVITSDKRIRQAMSYAIDRPTLIKEIYGGYAAPPNGQIYNPSTFGYDPTMQDYPYDLDKAKQLVKEAGAEGKELLLVGQNANRWLKDREVQEATAAMIGKTGLNVTLKLYEIAEWQKVLFEVENPVAAAVYTSIGNDLLDPDRIFAAFIKTGGRVSTYSSPELDQMIEAERAELDQNKRAELLRKLARAVHDDAMIIPLAQLNWIYGVSPKLKFTPIPNGQLPIARMTLSG
jgi:peptide/nickel transport system substrate-binding protein